MSVCLYLCIFCMSGCLCLCVRMSFCLLVCMYVSLCVYICLSVRTYVYLCVIVCPSVCLCSLSDYLNRNQRSSLQILTPKITSKFHSKTSPKFHSKILLHKPLHSMAPLHSSTPLHSTPGCSICPSLVGGNYAVLYTKIKEIVQGKTQQSM